MSPSEAHVLWVGIFMEEDDKTQKILLNYAFNYGPVVASKGKFHGKCLSYSVYLTPMFSVCVRESL